MRCGATCWEKQRKRRYGVTRTAGVAICTWDFMPPLQHGATSSTQTPVAPSPATAWDEVMEPRRPRRLFSNQFSPCSTTTKGREIAHHQNSSDLLTSSSFRTWHRPVLALEFFLTNAGFDTENWRPSGRART